MQIDRVVAQIDYVAPQHVRDVIASLGRTEDLKFSRDVGWNFEADRELQ